MLKEKEHEFPTSGERRAGKKCATPSRKRTVRSSVQSVKEPESGMKVSYEPQNKENSESLNLRIKSALANLQESTETEEVKPSDVSGLMIDDSMTSETGKQPVYVDAGTKVDHPIDDLE